MLRSDSKSHFMGIEFTVISLSVRLTLEIHESSCGALEISREIKHLLTIRFFTTNMFGLIVEDPCVMRIRIRFFEFWIIMPDARRRVLDLFGFIIIFSGLHFGKGLEHRFNLRWFLFNDLGTRLERFDDRFFGRRFVLILKDFFVFLENEITFFGF